MMSAAKAHYDGIRAFSETDFTEDLRIIDVPTLVMHGDNDQIVPIADSTLLSAKLLKKGRLKVYAKFPHGRCTTYADVVNADLVAFPEPGNRQQTEAECRLHTVLLAVMALLQREQRITYRALRQVLGVDDDCLLAVRDELRFRPAGARGGRPGARLGAWRPRRPPQVLELPSLSHPPARMHP